MSKQTVNMGTAPSGAGGDDQRGAFTKINANFDEIYAAMGGNTLLSNLAAKYPVTGTQSSATACIFERGSNSNGEWLKTTDGTLICWGVKTSSVIPANSPSTPAVITFPQSFANIVYTVSGNATPVNSYDHYGITTVVRANGAQCQIIVRNGATAQAFEIVWFAIGRFN